MEIFNKNNNGKNENKTKKAVKKQMLVAAMIFIVKIFLMLLMIFAVVAVIEWLVKIFQPKNTVDKIYKELKIEDVSELVQIKGNTTDGYYLDFVDDIDKKLQDTIDYLNSTAGVKSGIDKEFLKKMIKTEVVTQMPDLGAEVSEDKGFQGITSILRITPNKDIGSLKDTGAGKETVKTEDDSNTDDMTNKSEISKQEKEVKTWEKGKELTLSAKAFVYSQEESKLHPGEKIDYWPAQKNKNTLQDLYLTKGTTVKYTGKYSISLDKMYNEGIIYVGIEKDDVKGYIKYNFINKDSGGNGSNDDDEVVNSGYISTGEEKTTDTIDSTVYKLKYVPKDTFDGYVTSGNKEALYCFTIDDDGNLFTATWSIGEDGKIEIQNNSAINLKTVLQNYIVPSAYLLYYYIEADYPDFSNDLADVALNSKIIMAVEDNVSTSKIKTTLENKKVSESSEFSYDWTTSGDPTEVTTESCRTKTEIIYADTWCVKLENKSLYKSDLLEVTVGKSKNIKILGTVDKKYGVEEIIGEKESGSGTDSKDVTNFVIENGIPKAETTTYTYAYKTYQRTRTITDSISNSYAEVDKVKPEAKEKVFTDLYKKHKMYNRLNDKRFLQILENDDRTANLVDLTKYLMYMATGVDYGVKEYDFSEYAETSFEEISAFGSSDILGDFLSAWESGAVWEYINGNGTYSSYVAKYVTKDKKQYICFADDEAQQTRNYGYGVCHTADAGKTYMHVSEYKQNGIDIASGKYDNLGVSRIDVSIVDNVKQMLLDNMKNSIKSDLAKKGVTNLTENQLNALTAVKYQYGNIGNFAEMYKKYGDTEELKNNAKAYGKGIVHPYYFVEVKPGGDYAKKRAAANWKAFHKGVYETASGKKLDPDSYSSNGDFLAVAKKLWNTVCTSGKYTQYGGASIPVKGPRIDCSSFVSWCLYEYGYTEFAPYQTDTSTFLSTNWNKKYGWEEISVGSGENPINTLKPGDIFVRNGSGTHHVTIVAEIKNGKLYSYDCGDTSANWNGTSGAPADKSYFLTEVGQGKIIRVKPKK